MADESPEPAEPANLHAHLSKAVGVKSSITDARRRIVHQAQKQLDTIIPTIAQWEKAVQAARGGGHLAYRRLRTLLDERTRLEAVVAKWGHLIPSDQDEGGDGSPA